jgi:hypothetical protein
LETARALLFGAIAAVEESAPRRITRKASVIAQHALALKENKLYAITPNSRK